jgi:protein tyrosine phosphatase (PTP) superfamily phosphohydrolase (DUF442 family)
MTPVTGVPAVPDAPAPMSAWKRLRVWLNMLFVDHSIFRFFFNTRRLVASGAYRSSHPMPYQLRRAKRAGVRSVLSLRGVETSIGSNVLEWETCHEQGLVLTNYPIGSRDAPGRDQLQVIARLLAEMPKPLLIHCKSGADRAGLVSAIYLMLQEKQPLELARRQLRFWPFGHIKQAKTGVLDHFFDCYQEHHLAHGTGFMDWVEHHYDKETVVKSFHSSWWANKVVDWVLRRE